MAKRKRSRPTYPEEFKQKAVRLVLDHGRSSADVAREIGCAASALRGWVKKTRAGELRSQPEAQESDAQREIARLRKQRDALRTLVIQLTSN